MTGPRRPIVAAPALLCWLALSCAGAPPPAPPRVEPPVARREPHRLENLGDVRIDDYYWLRERDDPEVIAYLEAENRYTDAVMASTRPLRDELYREQVGRLPRRAETSPVLDGGYRYWSRYEDGEEYPLYLRRAELSIASGEVAPEEVLIDGPALAEGHEYVEIGDPVVSPDGRFLAYGVDTVGRGAMTIRVKDLVTGRMLPDAIPDQTGALAWAADGRTLFTTGRDPESLRPDRVYRHVLGTEPADDEVLYVESDPEYRCYLQATRSRELVTIRCARRGTTEVRYLRADDPTGELRVIVPRSLSRVYSVDHAGDRLYLRIDDRGPGFRIVSAPLDDLSPGRWVEIVPHRDGVRIVDFLAFADHLVLLESEGGRRRVRIVPRPRGDAALPDGETGHVVAMEGGFRSVRLGENPRIDTESLRLSYGSPLRPWSDYDFHMDTHERVLVKRADAGCAIDPGAYRTERLVFPSRDGGRVPVTVVYPKGFRPDGTHPLLLYGYGAYGETVGPACDPALPSLLDRGFVYAVAHVRGGGLYGRAWYEAGRRMEKRHTFTDFIDAAEGLVAKRYADPERLYAWGESAGGLLIGAVVNMRPDLWHGAVAVAPFVDPVTTMLDDTIPLTTFEYDEWGDPREREVYDYMLGYSPYDNVAAHDYPHLLVVTGLEDSQVQYWEPAKWVAKLRATKTDDHLLLLRTEMHAGHLGPMGRFDRLRRTALEYAFLLDLAGRR